MKYKKLSPDDIQIPNYHTVSLVRMGNEAEIRYCSRINKPTNIKLNSEQYFNISSGEVRQYKNTAKNRSDSKQSLMKSFQRLRGIITTNVTNTRNVRFVTLTYKENMQDSHKLYDDFHKFNMRFQRYCKKNGWGNAEYICIIEPQGRGSFHAHVLYIWEKKAPYIPNKKLRELWGHGHAKINAINKTGVNGGIANYLIAYLTDAEIDPEVKDCLPKDSVKEVTGKDGKKKYIAKGARLYMYHSYTKLFRCSSGIKRPEKTNMLMCEAKKEVAGMEMHYQKAFELQNDDGFAVTVKTLEYRKNNMV
ncbi:MAG: hypothetical protein LUI14_07910 [Lachnospiraceae bacterium]|nr:hypothetical protein [Lachnospiraceae bacterium]